MGHIKEFSNVECKDWGWISFVIIFGFLETFNCIEPPGSSTTLLAYENLFFTNG
jgi:hypothetical protein